MRLLKLFTVLWLVTVFVVACGQKKEPAEQYSIEDMGRIEQELKKEIRARKIDVVQMKQEIGTFQDTVKSGLMEEIDDIENQLLTVETHIDQLKTVRKTGWYELKSKVDSSMDYLGLRIDTTKTHIKQTQ